MSDNRTSRWAAVIDMNRGRMGDPEGELEIISSRYGHLLLRWTSDDGCKFWTLRRAYDGVRLVSGVL